MNKRKAGLVTAGVVTALLAASPLAWAVGPSAQADPNCTFTADGDDAVATDGPDLPLNALLQAPVAGDNTGIVGQCSTYNNDNGQGNFQDNTGPLPLPNLPAPPNGGPVDQ